MSYTLKTKKLKNKNKTKSERIIACNLGGI